MVEYKVRLLGSDGKEYIITYQRLKQNLGICDLEQRVSQLEKPIRKQEILDLLQKEGPRTYNYIFRRIYKMRFSDFDELLTEGKITSRKSGTRTMYEVKQ